MQIQLVYTLIVAKFHFTWC